MSWINHVVTTLKDVKHLRIRITRAEKRLQESPTPTEKALPVEQRFQNALHVEVITLGPIHAKFIEFWPRINERVHAAARTIIDQHIDDPDSFIQRSELEYDLYFSCTTPFEAGLRAKQIQNDIEMIFSDVLDSGKANLSETTTCGAVIKNGDVEQGGAGVAVGMPLIFRAGTHLHLRKKNHKRPPMYIDENGKQALPHPVQIDWQPMWDTSLRRITGLACAPFHERTEGEVYRDYYIVPEGSTADIYAELDTNIHKAAQQFFAKAPKQLNALCKVHFKTLVNPELRMKFFNDWKTIPSDQLRARLIIEVCHPPTILLEEEMLPFMKQLKDLASQVMLCTALDRTENDLIVKLGFTGVTTDLLPIQSFPAALYDGKLKKYAAAASKRGLRTVAYGIETPGWLCLARETGFSCVTSSKIQELIEGM
jgi:hypothetical protein